MYPLRNRACLKILILKSKERCAAGQQLEIMRITEQLTQKFVVNADNLSTANKKRLKDITESGKPCAQLWICGLYLYGMLINGAKTGRFNTHNLGIQKYRIESCQIQKCKTFSLAAFLYIF